MAAGIQTIIYPVKDVEGAKALFRALLGVDPYVDSPYYVGFRVGEQELGLDPNGHRQGMTGPVCYVQVENMDASVKTLTEAGATVQSAPKDVGGGMLVATMLDADGNPIGLRQLP